jgi:hypothetical protein
MEQVLFSHQNLRKAPCLYFKWHVTLKATLFSVVQDDMGDCHILFVENGLGRREGKTCERFHCIEPNIYMLEYLREWLHN